jgi:hypothetical protein
LNRHGTQVRRAKSTRNCGELRPRGDLAMSINGICHLCRANPAARQRDTREILDIWEKMDEGAFEGKEDEGTEDEHDEDQDLSS